MTVCSARVSRAKAARRGCWRAPWIGRHDAGVQWIYPHQSAGWRKVLREQQALWGTSVCSCRTCVGSVLTRTTSHDQRPLPQVSLSVWLLDWFWCRGEKSSFAKLNGFGGVAKVLQLVVPFGAELFEPLPTRASSGPSCIRKGGGGGGRCKLEENSVPFGCVYAAQAPTRPPHTYVPVPRFPCLFLSVVLAGLESRPARCILSGTERAGPAPRGRSAAASRPGPDK